MGDETQGLGECLRYQDAIERVCVQKRQRRESCCVRTRYFEESVPT